MLEHTARRRGDLLAILHQRPARLRTRDLHERALRPDEQHEHGDSEAKRRPSADRSPSAVGANAQRDRERRLGYVVGEPVEIYPGRREVLPPPSQLAIGAVEQHL